jgi:hypothetical protein
VTLGASLSESFSSFSSARHDKFVLFCFLLKKSFVSNPKRSEFFLFEIQYVHYVEQIRSQSLSLCGMPAGRARARLHENSSVFGGIRRSQYSFYTDYRFLKCGAELAPGKKSRWLLAYYNTSYT